MRAVFQLYTYHADRIGWITDVVTDIEQQKKIRFGTPIIYDDGVNEGPRGVDREPFIVVQALRRDADGGLVLQGGQYIADLAEIPVPRLDPATLEAWLEQDRQDFAALREKLRRASNVLEWVFGEAGDDVDKIHRIELTCHQHADGARSCEFLVSKGEKDEHIVKVTVAPLD